MEAVKSIISGPVEAEKQIISGPVEAEKQIISGPVEGSDVEKSVSLGEYFLDRLNKYGDKVALVQKIQGSEITVTYAELLRHGKIVSGLLREHGLKSGDTLMLCCGNTLEFAPILLGALFVGAAMAPVNPAYHSTDLLHLLSVTQPQLVISNSQSEASVQEALSRYNKPVVFVTMEAVINRLNDMCDVTDFYLGAVERPDSHVAFVLCSSGTSGKPKGVETTHATILLRLRTLHMFPPQLTDRAVTMNISGPFWVSCQLMTLFSLSRGRKLVLLAKFSVEDFLTEIQTHRINVVMIGPDQLVALAKHPSTAPYNLSSLQAVIYGGAVMSQTMLEHAQNNLRHAITILYGLTECIGIFTPSYGVTGKPGTIGTPSTSVQAKVVAIESGAPVGATVEGELCIRSQALFKRYRGNQQATNDMFDEDGFLHTGDIGYYDKEGFFYIIDRLKELFKYNGIHVPAVDIEEVLLSHPQVQEAAVVGIYHEVDCAHATAFVVRRAGCAVDTHELVKLVQDTLPSYKWLYGGVRFVQSLPRTASGKIQKYQLKQLYGKASRAALT